MFSALNAEDVSALGRGEFFGVVTDMPSSYYHSPALSKYYSSSDLKVLYSESPRHFKRYLEQRGSMRPSVDMLRGSMFHTLLLEPENFDRDYFVMPEFDARTKEGKAIRDDALLQKGDREEVPSSVYEEAKGMAMSVAAHKPSVDLLLGARREVSIFFRCAFSGLSMKARVDAISGSKMIEVKSARSVKPSAFERQAYDLNYDLSLYHYMLAINQAYGFDIVSEYYFLACENYEPYVPQCFKASELLIESGHDKWVEAVNKLEQGLASEFSHGYVVDEFEPYPILGIPRWAITKGVSDVV
jgi:exodeoxyribonuclease VIII